MKNQWPKAKTAAVKAAFRRLPATVGRVVVNFALENFRKEGFQAATLQPWPARKRQTRADTRTGRKRGLLIQTGTLRRSIGIMSTTPRSVTVGSTITYARIHNEGGTVRSKGRDYIVIGGRAVWLRNATAARRRASGQYVKTSQGATIKIPARRFLGKSSVLDTRISHKVRTVLDKALNQK